MTATAGYPAQLKNGANIVAETKKLDLGFDIDQYDTTKMTGYGGSNWRTFIPGLAKATCKGDFSLDMTDTNGQLAFFNAISSGASFTLHCLTGVTATSSFDITAFVKNFSPSLDVSKENTVAIEFQPTGAVSFTP